MRPEYQYGKSVIITGASSGIGQSAANAFAAKGYHVFALARSFRIETLPYYNGVLTKIPMDVCDEESIETAIDYIVEEMKAESGGGESAGFPLIIIHCAGMGIAGAAEDTPIESVRSQFDVNYFGALRVNKKVLPLMRKEGKGLVIIVGSVAGRISIPYQSHYSATKYALDAYAEALRMESERFGIRVSLIEPGDTKTGFTKSRKLCIPKDSPYEKACKSAVAKMAHDEECGASPSKVARVALKIAEKKNPPLRITVGLSYKLIMLLRRLLPVRVFDAVIKRMYR
jgi:short-subunit dehydrogenase